jgi:hypothetical protein
MTEQWRPVVGWEGIYEVSNLGRVKRVATEPRNRCGKILKNRVSNYGYENVELSRQPYRTEVKQVHEMVAGAFIGPKPPGTEINHKDGNKRNNRWDNHEYVTHAENSRHAVATGLMRTGDKCHTAKLSETQAREILALAGTMMQKDIAAKYGVHFKTVSDLVLGKTWRCIPR